MTVSGPPATLKQLLDSAYAFGTTSYPVPISGPYHAEHLHSKANPEHFLRLSESHTSSVLAGYTLLLPLLSSSTGSLYDPHLSTRDLLSLIIHDIVSRPLQLERLLDRCVEIAKSHPNSQCTIHSFSPSLAGSSLLATLKKETDIDVTLDQPPAQTSLVTDINEKPRSSKKSKIAIVGMAGRFPNAADHEKFWELLEAGLDVHRKVRSIFVIRQSVTLLYGDL